MKVYELSKKFNLSNHDMIKIVKNLKTQVEKDINSFTSLTPKEIKVIEKHLVKKEKTKKRLLNNKEASLQEHGEVLIVKKGKKGDHKEKQAKKVILQGKGEKGKIEDKEKVVEKKLPLAPRKVVVRRKKVKEYNANKENFKAVEELPKDSNLNVLPNKHIEAYATKTSVDTHNIDKQFIKPDKSKFTNDNKKDIIHITKNKGLKREFSKKDTKRWDDWKRKGGKRKTYSNDYNNKTTLKSLSKKSKPKELQISSVPKLIEIMDTITVSELAKKLNIKASNIIAKLFSWGTVATINQVIDSDTAILVANEYNCETKIVSLYDETVIDELKDKEEDLRTRPPIVTVMGHVDHGKTKLLDSIREADVTSTESGGITQHIGAYEITTEKGKVVFLDTPGHEAFTAMRARGAKVTDIVVLVVAADDGVMPQTIEAINHSKEANVPIVVAINKIDSPNANSDMVRQQLSDYGLISEEWGGKSIMVEVSALKKMNLEKLIEAILLEAELLELKANPDRVAGGTIIESKIDIGRGPVATVLVQSGTLRVGDSFVSGVYSGRVRALFNYKGQTIDNVMPSCPVEVLGLDGVPNAGDPFNVVDDDKTARQYSQKRQELHRVEQAKLVKKVTLDDLSRQIKSGEIKELKIVLKGDVQGSIEALKDAFIKLSNDEIEVKVIHSSTGAINENDVMLASASNAIIIGFHVRPNNKASQLAQREHVEIRKHSIIYDAINSIKSAMEGLLEPELEEVVTGQVEVRELFRVPKVGIIAGCYVTQGKIVKSNKVRVIRDSVEIYEGEILALKRFKDDVTEVKDQFECGISIKNFNDFKTSDIIEGFFIKETAKTIS